MTRKQQRITAIILVLLGAAVAAALVLFALRDNVTFFLTPTDVAQVSVRPFAGGKAVRLGGLVVYGTVEKQGLVTRFVVTDLKNDIPVVYHGILPDLFREGQGVVVTGTYDGTFHATQLLAKHDENYMPPEVEKMLEKNGYEDEVKQ